MIEALNFENAYRYGDTLPVLLRMRYGEFVERLKYEVPSYNGMEYDQHDTLAAVYLIWRDEAGKIQAGSRISPRNRPYMIPNLVEFIDVPCSPRVWEITRIPSSTR